MFLLMTASIYFGQAILQYVGDRGYDAANRASIDEGSLNLPDGARYCHTTIAVETPESVGVISKLIPAPDTPFS